MIGKAKTNSRLTKRGIIKMHESGARLQANVFQETRNFC
jgi:hypothetical protein